jgi:ABC-type uncharacterized transport system permease subunit
MFTGISITCFAASYAVSLSLEVSRLFFRASIRFFVIVGFTAAGLLAHTLYLAVRAQSAVAGRGIAPLASWYDFCLVAAWVLAAAYLIWCVRRPQNAVGVFLLPLVLALIGLAVLSRDVTPFPEQTALYAWRLVHSLALMAGTVTVALGFATGLMYLIQSFRLKRKLPPRPGFRLPSLEALQRFNRESLVVSICLIAIGLLAGIAMNLLASAEEGRPVSWTNPVVVSSGVLLAWLTAVSIFEAVYKPAWQGKKVAYLTLASFVFLGLALWFVIFEEHAVR